MIDKKIEIRVRQESGELVSLEEDNARRRIPVRSHEDVIGEEVEKHLDRIFERQVEAEIERRFEKLQERLEEQFEERVAAEVERRLEALADRQ